MSRPHGYGDDPEGPPGGHECPDCPHDGTTCVNDYGRRAKERR